MKDTYTEPSLKEYTAFHGMLCRPETARKAIQSFQGGTLLFASQTVYDGAAQGKANLAHYDCRVAPIRLNLWTYYILVLMSFTGLCSLLGYRKVISSLEYGDNSTTGEICERFKKGDKKCIESTTSSSMLPLQLPSEAVDYVIDQSAMLQQANASSTGAKEIQAEVILVRKFEYDFGGFLSVMMLHFLDMNGTTHLVEIYRLNKETAIGAIANAMIELLNRINKFLIHAREQRQESVEATKKAE